MDTLVFFNSKIVSGLPLTSPLSSATSSTCKLPTSCFTIAPPKKLFVSPHKNRRKLGFGFCSSSSSSSFSSSSSSSSSSVRKLEITCGGVTEISESQFSEVVLKSDRPVLVEFVANWCGPCRLISPAVEWVSQEYKEKLTIVKIDHDSNPRLIEEYKVYGLPTLILFKNGQQVPESRREGAITKVKLKEYVDALLESISVT